MNNIKNIKDDKKVEVMPAMSDKSFYEADKNMPAAEVISKILLSLTDKIKSYILGVVGGKDADALHDLRVGVRRIKTLLKIFGRYLSDDGITFKRKFSKIMKETQQKRDLDVLFGSLNSYVNNVDVNANANVAKGEDEDENENGNGEGYGKEGIRANISKEIELEQSRILSFLGSREFKGFLQDWEEAASKNVLFAERLSTVCPAEYFSFKINKVYKKLRKTIKNASFDDEELHKLRLLFKEFRYTLEFSGGIFTENKGISSSIMDDLKKIQNALGDAHDKIFQISYLKKCTGGGKEIRKDMKKLLEKNRENVVKLTEKFRDDDRIKSFIYSLSEYNQKQNPRQNYNAG